MRNFFLTLIVLISILSCQNDFELNQVIDQSSPIILTQRNKKVESGLFKVDTLKIKSEKWNKFIHFAINDNGNWKPTLASYNSDFYIQQDDFTLLGWNEGNFAVINYIDKNGVIKQLIKEINKDKLNFLTE